MEKKPKVPAGRIFIAVVLGVLTFTSISFFFWIDSVADRKWEDLKVRVRRLESEATYGGPPRPVITENVIPGNSWNDYARALELLDRSGASTHEINNYVKRPSKVNHAVIGAFLSRYTAILNCILEGTRREQGQYPYRWAGSVEVDTTLLYRSRTLALLATAQARTDRVAGNPSESLVWLSALLQLARDQGFNGNDAGYRIATRTYFMATEELGELLVEGELPTQDLRRLERTLENVEGGLPDLSVTFRNELLTVGYTLIDPDADPPEMDTSWRFGFSPRIAAANCFVYGQEGYAEVYRASSLEEEQRLVRAYYSNERDRYGPHAETLLSFPDPHQRREVLTQLRLLRVAAHFAATGEMLGLEDPFGGRLRSRSDGGEMIFWSVGRNGSDDGGTGRWSWRRPIPGLRSRPLDIVLRVPHPTGSDASGS